MNSTIIISLVVGYLLGSIPSAVWFGKIFRKLDVREYGSRNAGLTNTFRVFGWKVAVPVAVVDLGKGVAAPLIALVYFSESEWAPFLAGLAAIVGHSFTCFAQFRGGKGVLTALGVFLVLAWKPAIIAFAVFVLVVYLSRYISLGSICAVAALGVALSVVYAMGERSGADTALLATGWAVAILVVVKHRPNIERLRAGTESRFSFRSAPTVARNRENKGERQ